jgi:hypothetical protein
LKERRKSDPVIRRRTREIKANGIFMIFYFNSKYGNFLYSIKQKLF